MSLYRENGDEVPGNFSSLSGKMLNVILDRLKYRLLIDFDGFDVSRPL